MNENIMNTEEEKVVQMPVNEEAEVLDEESVVIDEMENTQPDDEAISIAEDSEAMVIDENLNIIGDNAEEVEEQEPISIYHFTHNDADAVGCALVASFFTNSDTKSIFESLDKIDNTIISFLSDKNHPAPNVIIISDVSLKDETCNFLMNYCMTRGEETSIPIMLFDHHVTNKMNEKYEWCVVQTEDNGVPISAAKLMFNRLYDTIEPAYRDSMGIIIDAISRYDTWEWKRHPIDYREEYTNILIKQTGVVETLLSLRRSLINSIGLEGPVFKFEDTALLLIDTYLKKREKVLNGIQDRGVVATTFQEYTIALMIPDSIFFNESMEAIYEADDTIDIVYGLCPETKTLHLRSNKDDVNLARFAKYYYGGGGHKQAAGAKLSRKKFIKLLNMYYRGIEFIENEEKRMREESEENN